MIDIAKLKNELTTMVEGANDLQSLEAARVTALGKKGQITALMKTLGLQAYRFFQDQLTQCDWHLKETMDQLVAEMAIEAPLAQPEVAEGKSKSEDDGKSEEGGRLRLCRG